MSFADFGVILVDEMKGVIKQMKRYSRTCSLMGINHLILEVNKMKLIDYDKATFCQIKQDFEQFLYNFNLKSIQVIPASAITGDNVTKKSLNTPWYDGKPLLQFLEDIDLSDDMDYASFAMPLQRVSHLHNQFRSFQGQVKSAHLNVGDKVITLPSEERANEKNFLVKDQESYQKVFIC